MPDGSTSRFSATVSDDEIRTQWQHAKTRQTLIAAMWTSLIAVLSLLFFHYLFQAGYRVLLYVIYGNKAHATP